MALPADRVAVAAIYKDGALEIRIPEPKHEPAKKTAISQDWPAGRPGLSAAHRPGR